MVIAGIILVVLQAIAFISSLIAGRNPFEGGLFGIIGYFFFGIIGVILIVVGMKYPAKKERKNTVKPEPDFSLYEKKEFELWLIESGYKEHNKDGKPGVVYQYSKAVGAVVEAEKLSSWEELKYNIDFYIGKYDSTGVSADKTHRALANALKKYKEFLENMGYIIAPNQTKVSNTDKAGIIGGPENKMERNRYKMDKNLEIKYSKMFKRSFEQIIHEEIFNINDKQCILYTFLHLNGFDFIGDFGYLVVVQTPVPRYFASEYSFNNTFVLCEWVFDGEREIEHINYGEVVSSLSDILNHSENIKKKLKEILNMEFLEKKGYITVPNQTKSVEKTDNENTVKPEITPKLVHKKPLYGKREFEFYLIHMGYKEYTPSGMPSAVYQYSNAIDSVVNIEGLSSWKELEDNIDLYIKQYDKGGLKENIGNKSHRTVINALKRYKEFLIFTS